MTLLRTQEILILCLTECQQREITRYLKWSEGATGATIKRLVDRKLLSKTDRGKYETTEKGRKTLRTQIVESPVREIIEVITQAAILIESRFRYTPAINAPPPIEYENEDERRRVQMDIYHELRNIYFDSIKNSHYDIEFILAIWKAHRKPICSDHGFDFIQAFKKNAKIIKDLPKQEVFKAIKLTPSTDLIKKAKKEFYGDYPELEFTVLKELIEKHLIE